MKQHIISLHGSYYGNNYGDILLIRLFAEWIRDICPTSIINLPFANRKKTKELPKGLTGGFNLIRSDALVFCGGGYFGEPPINKSRWAIRNFFRHAIVAYIAWLFRIPYVIIGVEFGPISIGWFRKVCIFIAKHAVIVVVRNQESMFFLKESGVQNIKMSADAVLTLSEKVVPKTADLRKKEILIHMPDVIFFKDNICLKFFRDLAKVIKDTKEGYSVVFVFDDYYCIKNEVMEPIYNILSEYNVNYSIYAYQGCENLIKKINDASFVVTTKLHVGITSASLNNNVLSIWTHGKIPRFHEQIGNKENCIPMASIFEDSNFYERLNMFLNKKQFVLPEEAKQLALINKFFLEKFLMRL